MTKNYTHYSNEHHYKYLNPPDVKGVLSFLPYENTVYKSLFNQYQKCQEDTKIHQTIMA